MKIFFIKFRFLGLFLAIFLIGILLSLVPVQKQEAREIRNKSTGGSGAVKTVQGGYLTLAGQFFMAVGSAGAAVRGVVEVFRWVVPRKKP